jgi:hypothetical protein
MKDRGEETTLTQHTDRVTKTAVVRLAYVQQDSIQGVSRMSRVEENHHY